MVGHKVFILCVKIGNMKDHRKLYLIKAINREDENGGI
jgi:hypothetical protein